MIDLSANRLCVQCVGQLDTYADRFLWKIWSPFDSMCNQIGKVQQRAMKNLTINYNKKQYKIKADSLKSLKEVVFQTISVPPQNLKIIKPALKNEQAFAKLVDGVEIMVMGAQKEQLKKLEKTNQLGIEYTKEKIGCITYVTSSIQVLKSIPEFKQFCQDQNDDMNADKLMAIDLGKIFKEIDEVTKDKPVSPIDIITSWVAYAEEFGDYPYKTYDAADFFTKIIQMMEYAAVDDYDQHMDAPNVIHDMLRVKYKANEVDTKNQMQDLLPLETADRERTIYLNPCDINSDTPTLTAGLTTYFKGKREKIRQIYGIDIFYDQKLISYTSLPPYFLVKMERFKKKDGPKTAKEVRYEKWIDLTPFCDDSLVKTFQQGVASRNDKFEQLKKHAEFGNYQKEAKLQTPGITQMEIMYGFWQKLMSAQEYDKYVNKKSEGDPTGQYNLVALVTHKGEKIDDECYFRGVCNRKGKDWYLFKEGVVTIGSTSEALGFVGSNQDCKAQTAHILVYKSIMFPSQ